MVNQNGEPLGERNPRGLQDDYVKFIRFGQWRIEQSGQGILAFITNHSYLDNPTFRGMRLQLMQTFTNLYILNLHGNSLKQELSPDGSSDKNVFDIQQGVAIALFIKEPNKKGTSKIYYADLWGQREQKYKQLFEDDIQTTKWNQLTPELPFYLFIPQDANLWNEYNTGWKITDILPVNSVGIFTARDSLTIHWSSEEVQNIVKHFAGLPEEEARATYQLGDDVRDWKITLAQNDLINSRLDTNKIVPISYRPFDVRFTYYTGKLKGFICMPRFEVMQHLLKRDNLAIAFIRRSRRENVANFFVINNLGDKTVLSSADNANIAPLYLYPTGEAGKSKGAAVKANLPGFEALAGFAGAAGVGWPPDAAHGGRVPNLNPAFVQAVAEKLGLAFQPHPLPPSVPPLAGGGSSPPPTSGEGRGVGVFTPEDIFHYLYAIFHSPTYRRRYAEFLKIDFPRVPLTSDVALFRTLCRLGQELVGLHLLDFSLPLTGGGPGRGLEGEVRFPVAGDNQVAKSYPKYTPPLAAQPGRIYLNPSQYFEGIAPEVWEFYIGGYQPLEKWLKDRQGRQLSYDELTHYRHMVAALGRTIDLMAQIDRAIPEWPLT